MLKEQSDSIASLEKPFSLQAESLDRIASEISRLMNAIEMITSSISHQSGSLEAIAKFASEDANRHQETINFLRTPLESIASLERPFSEQSESLDRVASELNRLLNIAEIMSYSISNQAESLESIAKIQSREELDTSERMKRTTDANFYLTEDPAGRATLLQYFRSEMAISNIFDELEQIAGDSESLKSFLKTAKQNLELAEIEDEEPKRSEGNWAKAKEGAKKVGKKLFDKANDLVKKSLGGGDSDS